MKKRLAVCLALVTMVGGLAAVPAMAADEKPVIDLPNKLDLGGEMRVRAWWQDFDNQDDRSYLDHRLRLYGKVNVAEGVKVHFRTDLSEQTWGATDSVYGAGRYPSQSMQVDRAFMELDKYNTRLRAGLQTYYITPSGAVDTQDEGFLVTYKTDVVTVNAFAVLDGSNDFAFDIPQEDWVLGADVKTTLGIVNAEFVAATFTGTYQEKDAEGALTVEQDENIYLVGAVASFDVGIASIFGEFDWFSGDVNDTVDAMGVQGYVGANLKLSDMLTLTPTFWYAMAADDNEVQVTHLGNGFNGWDPLFDVGTHLSNEKIGLGRPYDFTGTGAGVIGGSFISKIKLSNVLSLGAGINYLTVEDDGVYDDSMLGLVGGVSFKLMDNTSLDAQLEYHDYDNGDDVVEGGIYLGVEF